MAPREFRVKMAEPPAPAEPLTVLVRTFVSSATRRRGR